MAQARLDWLSLNLAAASRGLDSLPAIIPLGVTDPAFCLELETLWPGLEALRPAVRTRLDTSLVLAGAACDLPRTPR